MSHRRRSLVFFRFRPLVRARFMRSCFHKPTESLVHKVGRWAHRDPLTARMHPEGFPDMFGSNPFGT